MFQGRVFQSNLFPICLKNCSLCGTKNSVSLVSRDCETSGLGLPLLELRHLCLKMWSKMRNASVTMCMCYLTQLHSLPVRLSSCLPQKKPLLMLK